MNKKPLVIGLVLLAIAAGAYFTLRGSHGTAQALTLYGNVDIRETSLAFRAAGRVLAVKVDEGSVVKPGDVLAELDPEPLRNNVQAAEAAVAAVTARNALMHKGYRAEDQAQAQARVQAARAALTEAELQLKRQQQLAPEGASPQRLLDSAQSQRDQAAANLRQAEEQYRELSTGYRKEEIAESDGLLAQARANLEIARLALRDATLAAPSAGIILTRAVEQGSMVQVGTPAFSLSLTEPVWVRAYVNETQMGKFSTGTQVSLQTDSQPDHRYQGVVGFVSPSAEFTPKTVETADLRTSLVYRLRIVVQNPDAQLLQGMPVTVRLAP